jgi:class 3 adenylate cyclase
MADPAPPPGRILSPAAEREIRRLRFRDPGLERAFRADYAEKSRQSLRTIMTFMLPAPVLSALANAQMTPGIAAEGLFWLRNGAVMALAVGALLLTYSPHFPRLAQAYMAFITLVVGVSVIFFIVPAAGGAAPVTVLALVTFTLFRLRLRTAVAVYWTLIALFELASLRIFRTPAHRLATETFAILMANLAGTIACYGLELSARRDFLLSRLLEEERRKVEVERDRSERLLLNILPGSVAERLKETPGTVADSFAEVTVLFADIVDFTPLSAALPAEEVVRLLNEIFSAFDHLAETHGLEKIKTIGDAYMVVGGLPTPRAEHADAVAAMALEMQAAIAGFRRPDGEPLRLRIGINTGPVVAGVIGTKKFIYDLWGDTVNMASRMESHGLADGIQVTPATREQLKDRYRFEERPLSGVKGRGEMKAFLLLGSNEPPMNADGRR